MERPPEREVRDRPREVAVEFELDSREVRCLSTDEYQRSDSHLV
jgi:hypothetical protein